MFLAAARAAASAPVCAEADSSFQPRARERAQDTRDYPCSWSFGNNERVNFYGLCRVSRTGRVWDPVAKNGRPPTRFLHTIAFAAVRCRPPSKRDLPDECRRSLCPTLPLSGLGSEKLPEPSDADRPTRSPRSHPFGCLLSVSEAASGGSIGEGASAVTSRRRYVADDFGGAR